MNHILKIFVLLISFNLLSQVEKVNCIILVDNELPINNLKEGYIELPDRSKVFFEYELGDLQFLSNNIDKLKGLDNSEFVKLNLNFGDFVKDSPNIKYIKEFKVELLRQRYLLIRIFNCHNKKGEYFIYLQSPRYHNPYPVLKKRRKIKCE